MVLLVASYYFYGSWDWRFLSLIVFSSAVDYTIGLQLEKTEQQFKRKLLLWTSITVNIGLLGFFKYYNFFADNIIDAFSLFGYSLVSEKSTFLLNIILPVGISFYTFQTLSYTIDVYRKKLTAERNLLAFFAFVSFFPQLVAGPIERASNLLPQFKKKHVFQYAEGVNGLKQILWGLVQKVVIADTCAVQVNAIFDSYQELDSLSLAIGAVLFAFQIYGDFAGYSNIAIGTAKLFGFQLMQNFNYPYFSRNIGEFWRRWHISLSTWFRDYVYIPLGGSQVGKGRQVWNVAVVFLVSGFWHGANWTFIVWGALHTIFFLPSVIIGNNRKFRHSELGLIPSPKQFIQIAFTFALVCIAWIFFRAENIHQAIDYLQVMSTNFQLSPQVSVNTILLTVGIFAGIEWLEKDQKFALLSLGVKWKRPFRWSLYLVFAMAILLMARSEQEFIYFQF